MDKQRSMLPPDVRQQMERSSARRGSGGIGSGARENAATAQQRELAMNPDAVPAGEPETEEASPVEEDLKVCPIERCRTDLKDEWNFCAKCGADLIRGGAAKKLGIEFTDQDLSDYIFKGFVARELAILGKYKILVKSSQPQDADEMDNYLVNGKWQQETSGGQRKMSSFFMQQMQAMCVTAAGVLKIDGKLIGKDLEERVAYLRDRGSAFVDLLNGRVVLFNKALTEYLMRADAVMGS